MNIGNQIKALRIRKGVTQEAVAQHFNISPQAVSKWECGQSVPDIGMLPGLSAYFGVPIDELFALSDGASCVELARLNLQRIARPMYPLEDFEWIAQ